MANDSSDDYDPNSDVPMPTTSEALGNLLMTISRNSTLLGEQPMRSAGCLMGLPPYNEMYEITFLNGATAEDDGGGFMMTSRDCKLHVFGGQVVGAQHSGNLPPVDMHMKDFRTTVLEPSIFACNMGDTGARVYFNSGSTPQTGIVTLLTGCNRQNVMCGSYVLGYRVVQ